MKRAVDITPARTSTKPAAHKLLTTQLPMNPAAPVTKTADCNISRSSKKAATLRPRISSRNFR
jgi:hypothetical protein